MAAEITPVPFTALLPPPRIEYREDDQELWVIRTPAGGGDSVEQPILGGVTAASFFCKRRLNSNFLYVLERGTIDVTVRAGADATLGLEAGNSPPIRVIASTKPRRLDDD